MGRSSEKCMIKWYIYIGVFLLTNVQFLNAQIDNDTTEVFYYVIEGDSIHRDRISLDEVFLLSELQFDSKEAQRRYLLLKRRTHKVYPYAKLAAERLVVMNQRLEQIEKKKHKRIYTKRLQDYIENEFSEQLKKLTRSEGQILVKLIHRQTGETAFDLVKELRTGWRAFWYNVTANMFDISLKEEFNPYVNEEDYLIEDILLRAFQDKSLEKQEPAIPIDYFELRDYWRKKNMDNSP